MSAKKLFQSWHYLSFFLVIYCLILPLQLDASSKYVNKKIKNKKIVSEAGLNIPQWGVAIDAVYDNRLDKLIPGYKILNVVLSNRSPGTIYLDPRKDKWIIVDNIGRKHRAINHLKLEDENLWLKLPAGLRQKLEYPHAVRVTYSTKIDLFFPHTLELGGFREIIWESSHFNKEFNIFTSIDKDDENAKDEPLPSTSSYQQSLKKYEEEKRLLKNSEKDSVEMPPVTHEKIKEEPDIFTIPID